MNNSPPRIPEAIASEVFDRAARLYAQAAQGYSLAELIQAGAAANIPPKYIEQAVQEIQLRQFQVQERKRRLKDVLISAGVAIALLSIWNVNHFQPQALISRMMTSCSSMMGMRGQSETLN